MTTHVASSCMQSATDPSKDYLKLRMVAAHAETVIPLSALLGLFNNSAPWKGGYKGGEEIEGS